MQNQKLTETEKKIVRSRIKGQPFHELNETDNRIATDKIMLRGAAICGCALPVSENLAEIISHELTVFINEFGYCNLTLSEIILAMHLNATGKLQYVSGEKIERVEFAGVYFNVVYIAKVLEIYSILRNQLDRKLENQIAGY